jgi:hypothetical protein
MKSLIVSFLALTSVSAWAACPTFNASYLCKGEGVEEKLNVKTTLVNGVAQYQIDDTTVLADGVYRNVNFRGGQFDMAASCANNTLTLKILLDGGEGDNPACGAEKWNLRYNLNWTPAANKKDVNESHTGETVCASGKTIPSDDMKGSMVCVPQ